MMMHWIVHNFTRFDITYKLLPCSLWFDNSVLLCNKMHNDTPPSRASCHRASTYFLKISLNFINIYFVCNVSHVLMFAICMSSVLVYTMLFKTIGAGMWYFRMYGRRMHIHHKYTLRIHISCKHLHHKQVHCIHVTPSY